MYMKTKQLTYRTRNVIEGLRDLSLSPPLIVPAVGARASSDHFVGRRNDYLSFEELGLLRVAKYSDTFFCSAAL